MRVYDIYVNSELEGEALIEDNKIIETWAKFTDDEKERNEVYDCIECGMRNKFEFLVLDLETTGKIVITWRLTNRDHMTKVTGTERQLP